MANETFESFWADLLPVTKYALISAVVCTALFSFQMVSPLYFMTDVTRMVTNLEVWRVVTSCVFFGKFGFPWMMSVATFYLHLKNNEEAHRGKLADFVWLLITVVVLLHVAAVVLDMQLLSFALTMSLCWIWCRRNPTAQLSIYMFKFSANYFPFALMAFHLLMGMSIVDDIVGIVVGHLYLFLRDMLPKTHHVDLLQTPQWLIRMIPYERLGAYTVHAPAEARGGAAAPAAGRNWGRGRVLGA
jgi:Derlin-2/3